jgi:F-type H+-transporting ATPase subunit epsilon
MQFQLIELDGVAYDDTAYSVTLPTAAGEITVYEFHEPLMSVVVPGVVTIRKKKTDPEALLEHFATYGGVLEVESGRLRVLVDEADPADTISEQEAAKAHEAALKLKSEAKNQVELAKAQAVVDRHAVRLQVSQLKRRHRR